MNDTSILEAYEAQKKVIQSYKHKDEWLKALLANPTLNPTDKLILIETTPEPIKMGLPFDFEQAEEKKLYINGLAENIGISPDTYGSRLERLSRQGDTFKYDRRREPAEDGTPVLRVLVTPSPVLATPQAITLPQKGEGHGGKRTKKCSACGSENLVEKRQILCAECGTLQSETIHLVNVPENAIRQDDVWQSESQNLGEPSGNLTDIPVDTSCLSPCFDAIPQELKDLPRWEVWKYEDAEPGKKRPKVPYDAKPARNPQKAKSNDLATWSTFEQAKATYEQSQFWKYPYQGIMFALGNGYVGVDHDDCIHEGKLDEQALSRVIDTYGEISPSGTGFKQIARGSIQRNIKQSVEMYDHARFFTITGHRLPGTPETIEDRQTELDALFAEIAPAQVEPTEVRQRERVFTPSCSDEEVLSKARGAANGAKFIMLFDDGKWEEVLDDKGRRKYRTQSEADEGLCAMLRYWTDWNAEAIDRLFRQSKLMRPKWDRNAGAGVTYGEKTVSKALGEQLAS